mgnify:CR=1 FL=1
MKQGLNVLTGLRSLVLNVIAHSGGSTLMPFSLGRGHRLAGRADTRFITLFVEQIGMFWFLQGSWLIDMIEERRRFLVRMLRNHPLLLRQSFDG